MKLDIEEAQIKVDSGFSIVIPTFTFQRSKRWLEIQMEFNKRNIKAIKENLEEIEKQVIDAKAELKEQNQRINLRRIQIIEELKKAGEDVSEFTGKTPDYIG